MSTLIRDPMRPAGPVVRVTPANGGNWPADPRDSAMRPGVTPAHRPAPIGADWDPLCEPWPALFPATDQAHPNAVRPDPGMSGPPTQEAGFAPLQRLAPGQQAGFAGQPAGARGDARSQPPVWPGPGAVVSRPARQVVSLPLPPEPTPQRDVSPSRLNYRLNRLWLTPGVRHFVRHGLPVLLLVAALAGFWAGESRRAMVMGAFADLRAAVDARPEFRIDQVQVLTDTPEVAQAVLTLLGVALPASSLRLDLDDLRTRALTLDAVAAASVAVRTGGVLEVRLTERTPALVWRHSGGLELLDAEGRRVARIANRAVRPDLPLLAGEGAPQAVAEARQLLAAAAPIRDRMLGLVRVGERRWDVILDTDLRIQLPAQNAVTVLERVLALDSAHDLLSRDLVAVDMRNPVRPTLRLTPEASDELARIRNLNTRMSSR